MGFWKNQPAYVTPDKLDLFHYVREDPNFEAGKMAAVKLFRDVGVTEPGIIELCAGRYFNPAAADFERVCRELATAWLLGHQPPGRGGPRADDDSAWVPAGTLWHDHFTTIKEVNKFRADHLDMFRNPSPRRLEIHAAKWAAFWAARAKAGFEALDGDDPTVQDQLLAGAMQRKGEILAAKKKAGKQ
jgi:hypothetical protein